MQIGIGLDPSLGLTLEDEARVAREAADLGYSSIWTPENRSFDGFQLCSHRWAATTSVVSGGAWTGIAVSPVPLRTPMALAMGAATTSRITSGKFILGIGTGGIYRKAYRSALGLPGVFPLALMRDYLITVRALLAGETVVYAGPVLTLRGVKLDIEPSPTPLVLGALGPQMLRLAGELADGVCLNWCTPQHILWSRSRVIEGATEVGRTPSKLRVIAYIRVCIDEDVGSARGALARSFLRYALSFPHRAGYYAHFGRMGLGSTLAAIESDLRSGRSIDEIADTMPSDVLQQVGYFGPPGEAADAFLGLATGLDVAIARVVPARPGLQAVLKTLRALQPVTSLQVD